MSVSRLPSWAQPKGAVVAAAGARGARRPVHVAGDSRWAQRLGQEGYRLFSEGGDDATRPGDATVRASGFGAARKFTPEKSPGPSLLESFCEEEPNSASAAARRHSSDAVSGDKQESGDDVSRARVAGRGVRRASEGAGAGFERSDARAMSGRDSSGHGIDDVDIVEDKDGEKTSGKNGETAGNEDGENLGATDGAYSSDSDFEADASPRAFETGDQHELELEQIKRVDGMTPHDVNSRGGGDVAAHGDGSHVEEGDAYAERNGAPERNGLAERNSENGPEERNGVNGPEERNGVNGPAEGVVWDDDDDVELGEEMEDSPRTDLFSDHFDSLKRQTPVDTSRQSLSARFFARLSLSPAPPSSTPQKEPPESPSTGVRSIDVSENDDASLTSERERLKQRGREGRMAAEVARLRERMSGLGIAILPRASSGGVETTVTSPPVAVTSLSDAEARRSVVDLESAKTPVPPKNPVESFGAKTGGILASPLGEAWMVSDRLGRAVSLPGFVDVSSTADGMDHSRAGDTEKDAAASLVATTEGGTSSGAEGMAGEDATHNKTSVNEGLEPNPEDAAARAAAIALGLPRRLSPWASHTNPLFDRGETPPAPSIPPGAAAQSQPTGVPAQTLNLATTAETARNLFLNDAEEELRNGLANGDIGHVSSGDDSHVAHVEGNVTPPPQRSQSPDLDHERAHRIETPIEPLILDHTKRNAAAHRTEFGRSFSPSLSEGIPTVASAQLPDRDGSPGLWSELSFPRMDQPSNEQTPRALASLGLEDVESLENDAGVLRPVEVPGGSRTSDAQSCGESPDGIGGAKATNWLEKEVNANEIQSGEEWEEGSGARSFLEQKRKEETGTAKEATELSSADGFSRVANNCTPESTVERGSNEERTASDSSDKVQEGGVDEAKWDVSDGGDCLQAAHRTNLNGSTPKESCSDRKAGLLEEGLFLQQDDAPGVRGTRLDTSAVTETCGDDRGISTERRTADELSDPALPMQPGSRNAANRSDIEGYAAPSSFPATLPLPLLPVTESVELPRPTQEYQAALRALVDAADRASLLFEELKACKAQNVATLPRFGGDARVGGNARPGADVSALTQSYQEFVPSAVRKLQRMMQDTSSPAATDVTGALETSEKAFVSGVNTLDVDQPRDGVNAGMSKTRGGNGNAESMLASVDVEAVLERYSERYSERLAQQLLALMSRSLQGGQ